MRGILPTRCYRVLKALKNGEPYFQRDLVDATGMKQPYVSLALRELVDLNIVVKSNKTWRLAHPWDDVVKHLHASVDGYAEVWRQENHATLEALNGN